MQSPVKGQYLWTRGASIHQPGALPSTWVADERVFHLDAQAAVDDFEGPFFLRISQINNARPMAMINITHPTQSVSFGLFEVERVLSAWKAPNHIYVSGRLANINKIDSANPPVGLIGMTRIRGAL